MPKTFRDAVIVTRRLGLRFLWIDLLCILQGSKDDWTREASQMEEIYAQADFNIWADAGADSNTGLNGSRLMIGTEIGAFEPGVPIYTRPFPGPVSPHGVSHEPSGHYQQKPNVLDTRGWVLQERLLSPRIIHFAEHEIARECDTTIRCECDIRSRKPSARSFRNAIKDHANYVSYQNPWKDLVYSYSLLNLTVESDKLTAIAGLASRAAKFWSMTYINGLWMKDLPHGLFWRVNRFQPSLIPP